MDDMERIVHLDLKGAPPKINYLEKLFVCLRSWGATGLLVEWEDTFPYSGELADLGSRCRGEGAPYTQQQVACILQLAHDNNLTVMPLVQSIAHMEWVLMARRGLREVPHFPSCMCPSHAEAAPLVCEMLSQVLTVHTYAKYIHIGADEVWHLGVCAACGARAAADAAGAPALYLEHVRAVLRFLRDKFPHVQPVMWDDMLRKLPLHTLQEYGLGSLAQLMVWNYSPRESFHLGAALWDKYAQLFPDIWVASAFKGASGSCQMIPPISQHVSNQEAWRAELRTHGMKFRRVHGVALTGWARYDHYATLCELLPVGLPSLAHCLLAWTTTTDESGDLVSRAAHMLGTGARCDAASMSQVSHATFPGWELARAIAAFVLLRECCRELLHGDVVQTWLNPWQLENNFTNPMQTQCILAQAASMLAELSPLETQLSRELGAVLQRGADEWLGSNVTPLQQQLARLAHQVDSDVMTRCGAWIERLTRCSARERRARNHAVFALCYQLSRGVLAPPFLAAPPGYDVDLATCVAEDNLEGMTEGAPCDDADTPAQEAGGSFTRQQQPDARELLSNTQVWINPCDDSISRTEEYESCSMPQQPTPETTVGGGGGASTTGRDISNPQSTRVSSMSTTPLQVERPPDATYEVRAASLLSKLRDIKKENAFLNDELVALKQEARVQHSHSQHDLSTLVDEKDEDEILQRRLAHATHSRRLLQETVARLECRLQEVQHLAAMEVQDLEIKHKVELERTRTALTRQLERAATEHAERLQRATEAQANNVRETEERCAREMAEARAAHEATLRERDVLVREKEKEIQRLEAIVRDQEDKVQTATRSTEEVRQSWCAREQALERRAARADRARVRCARVCAARVARAQRETQLAECRAQLRLAEQRSQLRDAATRDSEADVTRAVTALENKYKDIVASVQAAAIKRRLHDQLSLQSLLQSCGVCASVGSCMPPPAPAQSARAHAHENPHSYCSEKCGEGRWCGAGPERDIAPAAPTRERDIRAFQQ